MRLLLLIICFVSLTNMLQATHLKGAEITASAANGNALTYQITLTVYLSHTGIVLKPLLRIGDGVTLSPALQAEEVISEELVKAIFTVQHSFPAPGLYTITYLSGSNESVVNASTSQALNFYASTALFVNPALLNNSVPVFKELPVFTAFPALVYRASFAATDADGDSLAYRITMPPGYAIPDEAGENKSGVFELNARTGLLTWDSPVVSGVYLVVVTVEEWRAGVLMSSTGRYMLLGVAGVTTGVDDSDAMPLHVFPNPGSNLIHIALPASTEYPLSLEVWSLKGQLTEKRYITSPKEKLEIETIHYPSGTYLLRLQSKSRSSVKKVIIRR